MRCEDAQELITGLIDNELSPHESALITAHFGECAECPKAYSRQYALKSLLRNAAKSVQASPELRNRVLAERRRRARYSWLVEIVGGRLPPTRSLALQAAAFLVLLSLPILTARYWLASPHFPIAPGILQSYRQIAAAEIVPVQMRDLAEMKEQLTRLVDGRFAPMAYDFASMNIRLVGGLRQEIANREVLVAVYQGEGLAILCYTFVGSEADAPEIAEVYFDAEKAMNFYQFHYRGTNAVMHREGDVICVLMSQMPMSDLLELARAKAHSS